MRVFTKEDGSYKRYSYTVNKSFQSTPTNVSVLQSDVNTSEITIITCVPIGGIAGRWVVKATLNDRTKPTTSTIEKIVTYSAKEMGYTTLTTTQQYRIDKIVASIRKINLTERQAVIRKVIFLLTTKLSTIFTDDEKKYFMDELTRIYIE